MPITSIPHDLYRFDSASVENCGPSMQRYVPPRWTAERRLQRLLFAVGHFGHVVEAAAADDACLHLHAEPSPFIAPSQSDHGIDISFSILLFANVARRDVGIVFEQDEILAV